MVVNFFKAAALSLALGLVAAPMAVARPGGKQGQGEFKKWMESVNLNADQKTKIKEIRKKSRDDLQKLRAEVRAKHDELRELLKSDGAADKARATHAQLQDTKRKLEDLQFESMLEIRAVLTPEQRAKVEAELGPPPGPWNKDRKHRGKKDGPNEPDAAAPDDDDE